LLVKALPLLAGGGGLQATNSACPGLVFYQRGEESGYCSSFAADPPGQFEMYPYFTNTLLNKNISLTFTPKYSHLEKVVFIPAAAHQPVCGCTGFPYHQ
jgi:hypothetical protein